MVKQVTKWIAADGREFDTEDQAIKHDNKMKNDLQTKVERFMNGYSAKKLLEKYSLNHRGVWEVRGEDPNCDMGGAHHEPYLGTFEGELGVVIEWAVKQDGFWQWGGGGSIRPIEVKMIHRSK